MNALSMLILACVALALLAGVVRHFENLGVELLHVRTLQSGFTVHREAWSVAELPVVRGEESRRRNRRLRDENKRYKRLSPDCAVFMTLGSYYGSPVVTRGTVTIRDGNVLVAYRASISSTLFFFCFFAALAISAVMLCVDPPDKPITGALILLGMLAGGTFVVRALIRAQIGQLRLVAMEATRSLLDQSPPQANHADR